MLGWSFDSRSALYWRKEAGFNVQGLRKAIEERRRQRSAGGAAGGSGGDDLLGTRW